MPNHLAGETSPYLKQHADQPVDWYPWGETALNRARSEDKPILLSIGYSACHWCHVMAHECFESDEIAALMNRDFINIKVDREERPDLDSIYMDAVQAITGGGGWPLTVFLTPEGKPFFGGTYFPPEDRHGIPGLPRVLKAVTDAYHHRRSEVEQAIGQLVNALSVKTEEPTAAEPLTTGILDAAYLALKQGFDPRNGGFGTAPKFPQPMALELLLRYFHRTQDTTALKMAELTLTKMASGGIYDQIGGGFHRYATDSHWLVPHFEKMLYDNAQLSQLYLHAYLATGNARYRSIAEETLDYVLREMTDPAGGCYSTQDADSEGVEGKYYLWSIEEINKTVSAEIASYFGASPEGNFEGKNILHVADASRPIPPDTLKKAKTILLKQRELRTKPGRDEKMLASWNGLMLASLAEAAGSLDRRDYLDAAVANGTLLVDSMILHGQLKHSYQDGTASIDGFLADYALVVSGLLQLHQATLEERWLKQAITLAHAMTEQFWDKSRHTFYDTSAQHQELFLRPRNIFDNALPSGTSAATLVLLELSLLTDNEELLNIATRSLLTIREQMRRNPFGLSNWLCALDFYLAHPKEIVLIGPRDDPKTQALLRTISTIWLPNKVVAARDPSHPTPPQVKLLEGRQMVNRQPTAYVCQRYTCHTPVTEPEELKRQLLEK
jgi:uncharacterized protein YyaL (SSP411 family)